MVYVEPRQGQILVALNLLEVGKREYYPFHSARIVQFEIFDF